MIYHRLEYNIVYIMIKLSFLYTGLASKLRVFIISLTLIIKKTDFIQTFKENQELQYNILVIQQI